MAVSRENLHFDLKREHFKGRHTLFIFSGKEKVTDWFIHNLLPVVITPGS